MVVRFGIFNLPENWRDLEAESCVAKMAARAKCTSAADRIADLACEFLSKSPAEERQTVLDDLKKALNELDSAHVDLAWIENREPMFPEHDD